MARKIQSRKNSNQKQFQGAKVEQSYKITPDEPPPLVINRINLVGKTETQKKAIKSWNSGSHLALLGVAGSGKSYLAFALALIELINNKGKSGIEKIVIIRSFVPSRDIGFLKGTAEEKGAVYESPYIEICDEITGIKGSYARLKAQGVVSFEPTSFMRSVTKHNAVIIIDEIQNLDWNEVKTSLTRLGQESRLIMCGDGKQDDITSKRYSTESGFYKLTKVIPLLPTVKVFEFDYNDILRSDFVKEFIMAVDELGY